MPPLPFELPAVTRGYSELSSGARAAGRRAADAAAAALAAQLGVPVRVDARPLPGHAAPPLGCARLCFDLPALPGVAVLEVEAAFVAAVVDRLVGGPGEVPGAVALTTVESAALELFALVALDALARDPALEDALSPRLTRRDVEPSSPLAVALELAAGSQRGRGLLRVPAAALRVFREPLDLLPPAVAGAALSASLRRGTATLDAAELAALSPGDVVLLDDVPEPPAVLALPAGARLVGRVDGDGDQPVFHLEETMQDGNGNLPVVLEVELARVPVTLGDLARLAPGAALPLAISRQPVVALKVGDRTVARGELVDVDGAVGVRILEVVE